jgi:hypothetical protein
MVDKSLYFKLFKNPYHARFYFSSLLSFPQIYSRIHPRKVKSQFKIKLGEKWRSKAKGLIRNFFNRISHQEEHRIFVLCLAQLSAWMITAAVLLNYNFYA